MGRSFFGQETEALGSDALGGAREAGGSGIRLDGGAHHLVEAARQRAGETPAHLAVALDHVGELRHLAGERLVEARRGVHRLLPAGHEGELALAA